jgi:transketolase
VIDSNKVAAPSRVTGNLLSSGAPTEGQTIDAPFGRALVRLAERNSRIVGLTADLGKYTDIDMFAQRFPERFFQMGMAEQNMIGVAAGLARTGLVPFATTYCVFATRRAYDFIAIGAALGKANVKIIAGLPGLTTGYGGTHQGIEDLALMRAIPNLVVIDPCDATELTQAVDAIAAHEGPVYMRLLRGKVRVVLNPDDYRFELGRAKLLRDGKDVALIGTGIMTGRALDAAAQLSSNSISAAVLHLGTIKPFDRDSVLSLANRIKNLVIVENHVVTGGLASAVADVLANAGLSARLRRIGIPDTFCESGSIPYLIRRYEMDTEHIVAAVHALLDQKRAL